MASVQIFPDLTVAIVAVDAQGFITPRHSSPTGLAGAPNVTHHSVEVRNGMGVGVLLDFGAPTPHSIHDTDYAEAAVFFDGPETAHRQIPMVEVDTNGGQYCFTTFTDRTTLAVKTAEFRALTTGTLNQLPFATNMAADR